MPPSEQAKPILYAPFVSPAAPANVLNENVGIPEIKPAGEFEALLSTTGSPMALNRGDTKCPAIGFGPPANVSVDASTPESTM